LIIIILFWTQFDLSSTWMGYSLWEMLVIMPVSCCMSVNITRDWIGNRNQRYHTYTHTYRHTYIQRPTYADQLIMYLAQARVLCHKKCDQKFRYVVIWTQRHFGRIKTCKLRETEKCPKNDIVINNIFEKHTLAWWFYWYWI
jgi:hypothetical protein